MFIGAELPHSGLRTPLLSITHPLQRKNMPSPEPSKLVNPVCLLHVVQIREGGQILEIGLDQVASQEVAVAVAA